MMIYMNFYTFSLSHSSLTSPDFASTPTIKAKCKEKRKKCFNPENYINSTLDSAVVKRAVRATILSCINLQHNTIMYLIRSSPDLHVVPAMESAFTDFTAEANCRGGIK